MIRQQLIKDLEEVIESLGLGKTTVSLDVPKDSSLGDYSSNVSFQLARRGKQSPEEIAKKIESSFPKREYLAEVEAVKGFLNFHLSPSFLQTQIEEIIAQNSSYGQSTIGSGKKARVEFISANPTGPLHIGNARGGPLGDTLANVLQKAGYEVLREYLHNNIGGQIKALGATIKAVNKGETLSENQYQGEYVRDLASKLKDESESLTDEEVGSKAAEILLNEIMEDSQKMGIKFDLVVKESDLQKDAPKIVSELKEKGVLKEKEGAWWLAPNDEFLKDRETVVVKSDGSFTYFTDDIVYHKQKFESKADLMVDVLGSGHFGHLPRIQAAMKAFGFDVEKLKFILYQQVRVKRGGEVIKMSKRAGNFVTAREVLDEVGKDAFRLFLLTNAPQSHMDFDLELAKKKAEENPVFYIQYAYARMSSVLRKSEENASDNFNPAFLKEKEEMDLIRRLIYFPDLVEDISAHFGVHSLAFYSLDLANHFHSFYEKIRVITTDKELSKSRLALVKAVRVVLGNCLSLMGISAPESM